jgi:hypothetical protein
MRLAKAILLAAFASSVSCRAVEPANHPEEKCQQACNARVSKCNESGCERGCRFILDRLVEREGNNVLACVAKAPGVCEDRLWADCAARVGPHVDGGPPPPAPPPEGFDEE